jgi:predicted transposase YbfD/YdcC
VLDVIFDEDHCRMRKKNSAKNMSVVRHLVLKEKEGDFIA